MSDKTESENFDAEQVAGNGLLDRRVFLRQGGGLLGALGAGFGAVINYWLGSSSDSGRKTELLAQSPAGK